MGYYIRRNGLDSFCLSIAMRIMALHGSRLARNVLCKASEASTVPLTLRSSWLDNLPTDMLISYISVSCSFQTLVQWYVIFVYFCILQFSDTGPVACYFRTLLCPAVFRHWSSDILYSYTSVSCSFQTLVQWRDTFVHFCILQFSDTDTLICYFRILLYPAGFRH
jgi:hypothetical protein